MRRLRNNEDMSAVTAEWMQTGLITAAIEFEDAGAWQPLIEQGAESAGMTTEEYKAGLKLQIQQQFSALQALSPGLRTQLIEASSQFIDSDTPQVELDINSKSPEGAGIFLVFMATLMSPNALENYFDIQVAAE